MGHGTTGSKVKSQIEVLVPAAAYAASFQVPPSTASGRARGSGLCAQFDDVILVANCTAVAGGGTATVNYQISLDDGDAWVTVDSMAAINGAGVTVKRIAAPIGQFYRLDVAITGTSVTFEVRADFGIRG